MAKSPRAIILGEALTATTRQRNKSYGSPVENLSHIAHLWTAYIAAKYNGKATFSVTSEDVAHLNQLQKMARTFAPGYHHDNYVDNAAYGAIAGECRQDLEDFSATEIGE